MGTSRRVRRDTEVRKARVAAKIKWWEENGGFIYWRDRPGYIYLPYGSLTGNKLKNKAKYDFSYAPQYDPLSDQVWLAQNTAGEINLRKNMTDWHDEEGKRWRVMEDRYTSYQYDLIRVALWYMMNGWNCKEVYELLIHPSIAFPLLPGQTPLVPTKIQSWKMIYVANLTRGFIWP